METVEKIVARNINSRMFELDYKIQDLVEKSGLSRQTISLILNGKRRARATNLDDIAKALKTTRAWLETVHYASDIPAVSSLDKTSLIGAIVARLPSLNEDELRGVLALVEGMPSFNASATTKIKRS